MVPSKAVLMRPLCFKTIAELSCRLRDALRICKVLHKCAVHMPVHSALACYIWYRDPDNMQYNRQFGLLCCSVDCEYTLRSIFLSVAAFFSHAQKLIMIVCGKSQDSLSHPRCTVLGTLWSTCDALLICDTVPPPPPQKKSIKPNTKKALNCVESIKMSIKYGFFETC